MIFSIADHVEQIINGSKTQTRRKSGSYIVGKLYSIQKTRKSLGIPNGRILIIEKRIEEQPFMIGFPDAQAEGKYIPEKFEKLYSGIYPSWIKRYAYTFRFVPNTWKGY